MSEKHVYIFGEIGWENNVKTVQQQIGRASAEDTIIAHIHSPGGSVDEGYAIHDHLLSYGATVETRIEGMCASIATIIALAGTKRTMTKNSTFFIHNPWTMAEGDASKLEETAEQLRSIEERISGFYSKVTGKSADEMLQIMKVAENITPELALELGFVTELVEPIKAMAKISPINQKPNNSNLETIMSEFMNKIEARMNKILGIKNQQQPEIKNLDTTLADGTEISISGESVAVGATVTIGGEPAPDGTHELADGMQIATVDGVITEIIEADGGDAEALKAENAQLKSELESVKAELSAVSEKFEAFVNNLEQKQPFFNRVQRQPMGRKNEKADRTGGKDAINARLNVQDKKK